MHIKVDIKDKFTEEAEVVQEMVKLLDGMYMYQRGCQEILETWYGREDNSCKAVKACKTIHFKKKLFP